MYENLIKEKYSEYFLQKIWNSISYTNKIFEGTQGEQIQVFFPGRWNFEEGPDFLSAEIKVDGKTLKGDVEIHLTPEDWFRHKHHLDERYKNVILHVVLRSSKTPENSNLGNIPTLIIPSDLLNQDNSLDNKKYPNGFCASLFKELPVSDIKKIFEETGLERMKEKAYSLSKEILKAGTFTAFYKSLFEACGYKSNKEAFKNLFERLLKYDIKDLDTTELSAIIWGESNLLPDYSREYIFDKDLENFAKEKWDIWWRLRKGKVDPLNWKRASVRPLNSPLRRLAAVIILMSRFKEQVYERLLYSFDNAYNTKNFWSGFKEFIICKDEFWDCYSDFQHKLDKRAAVLGENRALEITINVILPFMYAKADIENNQSLKDRVLEVFKSLPKTQSNLILKICSERWMIPPEKASSVFVSACIQQGVIFCYKNYCQELYMKCKNCSIYKELYSYLYKT